MTQLDTLRLHNAKYGRIFFSFKSNKLKINHSLSSIVFDTTKTMNTAPFTYTIKSYNLGTIVFDFSQNMIQYTDLNQNAYTFYNGAWTTNNSWCATEIDNEVCSYNPANGQFKFKELFNISELVINPEGSDLTPLHDLDTLFLICNLTTNV